MRHLSEDILIVYILIGKCVINEGNINKREVYSYMSGFNAPALLD